MEFPELGECSCDGTFFVMAMTVYRELCSCTFISDFFFGIQQFARIPNFRQSFCGWRFRVPPTLIVTNMFEGTSCPVTEPDLVSGSSFCTMCNTDDNVTAAPGT